VIRSPDHAKARRLPARNRAERPSFVTEMSDVGGQLNLVLPYNSIIVEIWIKKAR